MLFSYPEQAAVEQSIPKNKIYEHVRLTKTLRKKFVEQIAGIRWAYKLSAETVNLSSTESVPEIEIFVVDLKAGEVSHEVIRCIDNAIPYPIVYEIVSRGRVKVMAAYKRPSEADKKKWVTDTYFESDWQAADVSRQRLPVALDLARLYERMLSVLLPAAAREGEAIRETAVRIAQVRELQHKEAKLESELRRENQFNRQVEINKKLRDLRKQLKDLLK